MSKHSQLFRQIFALSAILYFFALSTASARQQLHGHVPAAIATAPFLGAMDPAATLNLAIGLPLQNQNELQQFLSDVYNPQSPLYHHFLTPDEFARRFGPNNSDYQSVMDFAQAHHLAVTKTYPNHLLVDVQGSVSDIQKTFHVNLNRYRRVDGSEFHAPDQEPSVDLDVSLTYISGLENSRVPKPALNLTPYNPPSPNGKKSASPNAGTGPGGTYFGSDFRNAYLTSACLPSSTQGQGQTVALVEFDRYYTSDITSYASAAGFSGFTSSQLTNVSVDGFSTSGAPVTTDGNLEVSLDIEMILCMSQSAQIYVYETDSNADDLFNEIATYPKNAVAQQISSSWTFSGDSITSAIFTTFAAQGQSYFQAAGDSGAYLAGNTVPDPIDISSEMTVVGGTELTTGPPGVTYSSETTWNDTYGASGGGICNSSTPVPIPTYQVPFVNASNDASNTYRNIPDVSMVAANIEDYYDNGLKTAVAGTSAATPLWAGFTALINETAASAVKGPMGFMNPFLYNLASNATTYTNDFNNIKDGSNNNASGTGLYPAVAGYNLATGLGSPKCNMITDLIAPLNTNTITPTPTNTRTPTPIPTPTFTPTPTNTPTPPSTTSSYAYPQPAHGGQVNLCYNSPIAQQVRINIYNISGQQVDSVMDNPVDSNQNRVTISLQGFVPSVYFYVINGLSSGVLATGKFLVVP